MTESAYASKPRVACAMNAVSCRSLTMISRAIEFESAMSVPTSMPSHRSPHSADSVRRGSTTINDAPLWIPFRTWSKNRMRRTRVRSPQQHEVGVLDLFV